MFIKTYGQLYQDNAQLFADLFADFQSYIDGHHVDLTDVLDRFFVELMRRIFALVNEVHPSALGDSYVSCMTTSIDRLKPFGDVPVKLATQLKRAFIAARALLRGLAVGRDVVSSLGKVCHFVCYALFATSSPQCISLLKSKLGIVNYCVDLLSHAWNSSTHTHTHAYMYIYIYIYSAACVQQVTVAPRCALLSVAFTNNVIGYSALLSEL